MAIDFHTHVFPDKIAEKAIPTLSVCAGGITPAYNGTVNELNNYLRYNNIEKAVVLNIATNPKQQKNVNDFAISLMNGNRIIPFGSIHPDSPDVFDELTRLKKAGIKGIKLHPDYQNFFVDEKRMLPIYKRISELGFITVFHAGVDIGYPEPVHCTPLMLKNILDIFGDAPVVTAHFGGYLLWNEVYKELCGTKIFIDTAFSAGRMPPVFAKKIIDKHGADKILFGSDMPWSSTVNELSFIKSLGLSVEDEEKILNRNAEKLLHI